MSQLSLYAGPSTEVDCDDSHILSFTDYVAEKKRKQFRLVGTPEQTARLKKKNQSCPSCNRITVEPVEVRNGGQRGRNGALLANTRTVIGFRCGSCQHKWSAR